MEKGSALRDDGGGQGCPPDLILEENEEDEPPGDEEAAPRLRARPEPPRWEYLALRGLTETERRLVLRRVRRAWRLWRQALRGGTPEDLVIEAVLELREVKARQAARSQEAGMGLLTTAIDRRLTRYAISQLHQRGMATAAPEPEVDPDEIPSLVAEGDGDWEAFLRDTLIDDVSDERILAALQTLRPADVCILDLWIIEDLTDEQIAARLNAQTREVKKQRPLTAESVRHRRRLMRGQIRAFLGGEGGA